MQETSEKDWIERAKENPRWFEPLYDKYFQQIFLFLFKRHGDETITAEIASDTFFKALTKIHQYRDRGLPFSSWLYRIALNQSNTYFRKNTKEKKYQIGIEQAELIADEFPIAENEKQFQELERALSTLNAKEIELIELRFFNELSFKQVAEVLKISENNAKVRCYRILDKMRIKIKNS